MRKIVKSGLLVSAFVLSLLLGSVSAMASVPAQDGELVIVAHFTVKPEYKEVMAEAFKVVIEETRKEPGNVSYVLHEHLDNPLNLTLVEVWKSQEAIDTHNNSVHFKQFVQAIDGKSDLVIYTMKEKF